MKIKILPLLLATLFAAFACPAQPTPQPAGQSVSGKSPVADTANYLVAIEWREPKGDPKSLELLTAEGQFQMDGIQKNPVKINDNEIPVTLKVSGTLNVLDEKKGSLRLFLGRTVPYLSGTFGAGNNKSYSQLSVGLQNTFNVTFGKPVVIQSDENGTITVTVKRLKD